MSEFYAINRFDTLYKFWRWVYTCARARAHMCKSGFDTLIVQPVASSYTDWAIPVQQGLHNEQLYDLHSSPNIISVVNWRKMRWAGHVARMGDRSSA